MNVTTMNPVVQPMMQPTGGCWQNFVSGAKTAGSWCGSKIQAGASIAWEATKKAAAWAANFFCALGAGIMMFARLYARELTIAGVALAAGIAIALICQRCFGCCNKPAATEASAPASTMIVEGEAEKERAKLLATEVEAAVVAKNGLAESSLPAVEVVEPSTTTAALVEAPATSAPAPTKKTEGEPVVATTVPVGDVVKTAQQALVKAGAALSATAKA